MKYCKGVALLAIMLAGVASAPCPSYGGNEIAYYPFNGNADDAADGHHGTPVGGVDFFTTPGQAGFDGSTGYITVPDHADLRGMSGLSATCKFKADSWPDYDATAKTAALVSKWDNGDGSDASDCYGIFIYRSGGKYRVDAGILGCGSKISLPGIPEDVLPGFEPYGWNDVALTWDGSIARLYLNGLELASEAFVCGELNNNVGEPLHLGHMNGTSVHNGYFDGCIDEVSIVPEPATLSLLVLGGLALIRRRR